MDKLLIFLWVLGISCGVLVMPLVLALIIYGVGYILGRRGVINAKTSQEIKKTSLRLACLLLIIYIIARLTLLIFFGFGREAGRSAILPKPPCRQAFIAQSSHLSSISVYLSTTPNGGDASEPVIAAIQDKNTNTLIAVTNMVSKGICGWVNFIVPEPGLKLKQGEEYIVTLIGTEHGLFAWTSEWNRRGQGKAIEFNKPNLRHDFLLNVK